MATATTPQETAPPELIEGISTGPPAVSPRIDPGDLAHLADELLLLSVRHRITVEQYHRMAEAGIFTADDRVELIEGMIVKKMTKHTPHMIATDLVNLVLAPLVRPAYFLSMGNPVTIPERDGEPEPDAHVMRGSPRDYAGGRYDPRNAVLVIEVAASSYAIDRKSKWRTYAAAGVPVYWILDLNRRALEVHTDPDPEGYRQVRVLGPDDEVPLVLDGREVARFAVRELLP